MEMSVIYMCKGDDESLIETSLMTLWVHRKPAPWINSENSSPLYPSHTVFLPLSTSCPIWVQLPLNLGSGSALLFSVLGFSLQTLLAYLVFAQFFIFESRSSLRTPRTVSHVKSPPGSTPCEELTIPLDETPRHRILSEPNAKSNKTEKCTAILYVWTSVIYECVRCNDETSLTTH
jgi:hypothetical protein